MERTPCRRISTDVITTTRVARAALALTAAAVLAVGVLSTNPTPATAEVAPKPTILVVGDSITARYNDTAGSPERGWWSFVGERLGANVVTAAQSGTGVIARGGSTQCALRSKNPYTTVGYRLTRSVKAVKPDAIIIASGANDWRRCADVTKKTKVVTKVKQKVKVKYKSNGKVKTKIVTKTVNKVTYKTTVTGTTVKNSNDYIRARMRSFLAQVKIDITAAKIPASQVAFMMPRGPALRADRDRVAVIMMDEVKRAGFSWVDVGLTTQANTVDGTHPNLAGNVEISGWFMLNLSRQAPKFMVAARK